MNAPLFLGAATLLLTNLSIYATYRLLRKHLLNNFSAMRTKLRDAEFRMTHVMSSQVISAENRAEDRAKARHEELTHTNFHQGAKQQ